MMKKQQNPFHGKFEEHNLLHLGKISKSATLLNFYPLKSNFFEDIFSKRNAQWKHHTIQALHNQSIAKSWVSTKCSTKKKTWQIWRFGKVVPIGKVHLTNSILLLPKRPLSQVCLPTSQANLTGLFWLIDEKLWNNKDLEGGLGDCCSSSCLRTFEISRHLIHNFSEC